MAGLRRKLTTFDLTMIAIGSTIGSGIFATPGGIMELLPAAPWVLLVWGIGGLVALSGALTFAELSTRNPSAGGVYAFLKDAYGPLAAFLYGWANLLVVTTGAIAALSMVFAEYLLYILEAIGIPLPDTMTPVLAITGIVFVTAVNLRGIDASKLFSNVFTMLKLAGIAALICCAFLLTDESHFSLSQALPASDKSISAAFAAALVGVFWSFGGWQHASFMAAESIDPKRSVARAMVIGTLVITTAYLLVNVAYMTVIPVDAHNPDVRIAARTMEALLGASGGILIAIAIFISTFGTTGIYTMTSPRLYHQMAKDGTFFPFFGEIHREFKTPFNAIMLQSGWAICLILLWGTFHDLINYVVFTDWIFMTMAAASLLIVRYRAAQTKSAEPFSGYRTPLFPLPPLIFVGISTWFLINELTGQPIHAVAGLSVLGLGVLLFFLRKN